MDYNLIGRVFGRLVVEGRVITTPDLPGRQSWWLCFCNVCRSYALKTGGAIRAGNNKTCGCTRSQWGMGKFKPYRDKKGYIRLHRPWHPNAKSNGSVSEHVMVMSHILGRPLRKGETVHHKNGIRSDNRPENLELWTSAHGYGVRVDDLTEFCVRHLSQHAPQLLSQGVLPDGL